jgi:hypothetical protein
MQASKTWEKDSEDANKDVANNEFAKGDDKEELQLDTFRHVMVR